MFQSLKNLENTLTEFEERIGEKRVEIDDILIWLEKYIRFVYGSNVHTKKGDDLIIPLDAAFNIAINLFTLIDTGTDGIDDKMAEELKKIKVKYLGG